VHYFNLHPRCPVFPLNEMYKQIPQGLTIMKRLNLTTFLHLTQGKDNINHYRQHVTLFSVTCINDLLHG